MQLPSRVLRSFQALCLGAALTSAASVGIAHAAAEIKFVGTGCDLSQVPAEWRPSTPLSDERFGPVSDSGGTCYIFLLEGFTGIFSLSGDLLRPDGTSTHVPGTGPATPGDPPGFLLIEGPSENVPPAFAEVLFFPRVRSYPAGNWTLITGDRDGHSATTQFAVGASSAAASSPVSSAQIAQPQLPVQSQVAITGNLPNEGDHKGRDLYAVDFVGGGDIVQSIAVGKVAYAGWNCQKATPDQPTCYGFSTVLDHGPSADGEIYSVYTHMDCSTLLQFSSDEAILQALADLCTSDTLGLDREITIARGLPAGGWIGSISDSGCRDERRISHCVSPAGPDPQGSGKHLHFAVHKGAPGLVGAQALFDPSLTAVNIWDPANPWHLPGLPSPPARGHIGPCWQNTTVLDDFCLLGNAPMSYTDRENLKHFAPVGALRSALPWQGDSVSLDFDYGTLQFVATLTPGSEDAGNAELDQFLHDHGIADRSWILNLVVVVGP